MSATAPVVAPQLAGIVVHWHDEQALARLLDTWPLDDDRFELVVVDNGSTDGLAALADRAGARVGVSGRRGLTILRPLENLGFAGGLNRGAEAARAPISLLLNADARPCPGALAAILDGFAQHPEAAGLVPRLVGEDGAAQYRWQLGRLPSAPALLAHTLMVPVPRGARREPEAGCAIEQPAAAVLAMRRSALEAVDGMDESFYPAWFEDVDLARRCRDHGLSFLYWPQAVFVHRLGSSVPTLGYGTFLSVYYRNLVRYLAKHHGALWAAAARVLLVPAALGRLVLLPLRRPRRAKSRRQAAAGLLQLASAALRGWPVAAPAAPGGTVAR